MALSPFQLTKAASAYRALIRAQRFTFKGDIEALAAAHQQTRLIFSRFVPSAASSLSSQPSPSTPSASTSTLAPLSPAEVDEHINAAFEIASYLRKNVVQGVQNEDGNYALRITEETERGDNDSIKAPSVTEARPMRAPLVENAGVKRRRRKPKTEEAQQAATPSPCCSG